MIRGGKLNDADIAEACEIDLTDVEKIRTRLKKKEEEAKKAVTA